jgi:hypothetical protein
MILYLPHSCPTDFHLDKRKTRSSRIVAPHSGYYDLAIVFLHEFVFVLHMDSAIFYFNALNAKTVQSKVAS